MTDNGEPVRSAETTRARRALQSLNFFMADMQAGIGPFLGVFLQQRGWATGPIGTVMTVQGVGAALSPAIGGWLAQMLGYRTAFFVLGGFALISLALWIGFAKTLRPACAGSSDKSKAVAA